MAARPAGSIDKAYISSIYFLDKKDILNQVMDVTNEDVNFLDVMDQFKRRVPASAAKFHHYVNLPYYSKITGTGVDWGTSLGVKAGQIVTVEKISATTGGTEALAGDSFYVKNPANVATGTVHLNDTGARTLVGDEVFVITSNAYGEGSVGPDPVRFGLKKYEAKAQIFKMAYELTDVELANKIEVEFGGKPYYMYKAQHDALLKYNVDISAQMMFGAGNASTFDGWEDNIQTPPNAASTAQITDNDTNNVQFTQGLDAWARSGFNETSTTGTTALDILGAVTKSMNVIRCPNNYMMILGTEANIALDNDIKALNVATNQAAQPGGHQLDVNGTSVNMSLDTFQLYGRSWTKTWMPMMDHEIGQAYLGADNSKTCYFIPNDKIKVIGEDGAVDRMRVRYLEGSNMSFGYREIKLGGLAPTPTDSRSVFECVYESIQGLQIVGSEHFGVALFPNT